MYNYWQIGAENGRKVPLASNQVVGGSNPSGRAIFSMTYDVSEKRIVLLKPVCPIRKRRCKWNIYLMTFII